jgi:hypothetical protein
MKSLIRFAQPRYIFTLLLLIVFTFSVSIISGCGSKTSNNSVESKGNTSSQVANDAAAPASQLSGSAADVSVQDRKTVQKADLNMRVQDVTEAVDQIIALCNDNGGYTVSSRVYRENDVVSGKLAIKVPQANLLAVINSISALGEVTDKTITAQDVTEEYYDSQARLKVLQAKEERLLGLMDKAANITEVISVENELTKTRSEIEVLAGRLQYLTNATEYSQINITLAQGVPGTVNAPQGTLGKAWQGLVDSLNGVITFASGTVVFIFTALPWLVLLALLFLLGRYGYRKVRGRKAKE